MELAVQALNCYDIHDRILSGEFDLGVHYDVGGFGSALAVERFGGYPLALIGSNDLTPSEKDFLTSGQRKKVCLITNDRNSIFQGICDAYLEVRRIEMGALLELGGIEAIKRSVASNLGVAFLPKFIVQREIEAGKIQLLEKRLDDETITVVCTYHKNKWITPAMELFIRLLKSHCGQNSNNSV